MHWKWQKWVLSWGPGGRQKKASDLKLRAVVNHPVWVPGTELRSSVKTVCTLNLGAISPAPQSGPFYVIYLLTEYKCKNKWGMLIGNETGRERMKKKGSDGFPRTEPVLWRLEGASLTPIGLEKTQLQLSCWDFLGHLAGSSQRRWCSRAKVFA